LSEDTNDLMLMGIILSPAYLFYGRSARHLTIKMDDGCYQIFRYMHDVIL
jgi:hypothetical protein